MLRRTSIAVLAVSLFGAACSSGPPSQEELLSTVNDYNTAFLAGDAETVLGMLTERCVESLGEELIRQSVLEAPELNPDLIHLGVVIDLFDEKTARVTTKFNDPEFDVESERWNVEDGAWKNDDCTG